jgi:hypothetical protein
MAKKSVDAKTQRAAKSAKDEEDSKMDASRQSELTGKGVPLGTTHVQDPSPYAQEGGLGNPDKTRRMADDSEE